MEKNQMEKKEIAIICGVCINIEKLGRWNEKAESINSLLVDWVDEWMQYGDCNVPSMHLPYWPFGAYKGLSKKRVIRYPKGWGGYNPWADYRPVLDIWEWENKHCKQQCKRWVEGEKLSKDLYFISFDSDCDNDVQWAKNSKWWDYDGIRYIFLLDIWDNMEFYRSYKYPRMYNGAYSGVYFNPMYRAVPPKKIAFRCTANNSDNCDWRFTFLSCLGFINHAYDYWRHLVNNTVFRPCLYNKAK